MLRKWWLVMLKALLVAVILYFAQRSLALKPADFITLLMNADYRFYVSMVLFAVFLMPQASIWVLIVNAAGAKTDSSMRLDILSGLSMFINSQFTKYVPGGFWNYAGRIVRNMTLPFLPLRIRAVKLSTGTNCFEQSVGHSVFVNIVVAFN